MRRRIAASAGKEGTFFLSCFPYVLILGGVADNAREVGLLTRAGSQVPFVGDFGARMGLRQAGRGAANGVVQDLAP